MTLGPLLLAGSLAMTSYVISVSKGLVSGMPGGVKFLLDVLQFVLFSVGMAAMYRYVPNTQVRWGHALVGGVFVSLGLESAQSLLAIYLKSVPTYSMVYGALATIPILLIWIYIAWVVVLLGAVIVAYLPSLLGGVVRRPGSAGWRFQLAVEIIQQLHKAKGGDAKGLSTSALAQALQVDVLELSKPMEELVAMDWVGLLESGDDKNEARWVLLGELGAMRLADLENRLLLNPSPAMQAYLQQRHAVPLMADKLLD
jgi:membrane protein